MEIFYINIFILTKIIQMYSSDILIKICFSKKINCHKLWLSNIYMMNNNLCLLAAIY